KPIQTAGTTKGLAPADVPLPEPIVKPQPKPLAPADAELPAPLVKPIQTTGKVKDLAPADVPLPEPLAKPWVAAKPAALKDAVNPPAPQGQSADDPVKPASAGKIKPLAPSDVPLPAPLTGPQTKNYGELPTLPSMGGKPKSLPPEGTPLPKP